MSPPVSHARMTSRRAATRAAPTRPVSAAVTFGRPRPEQEDRRELPQLSCPPRSGVCPSHGHRAARRLRAPDSAGCGGAERARRGQRDRKTRTRRGRFRRQLAGQRRPVQRRALQSAVPDLAGERRRPGTRLGDGHPEPDRALGGAAGDRRGRLPHGYPERRLRPRRRERGAALAVRPAGPARHGLRQLPLVALEPGRRRVGGTRLRRYGRLPARRDRRGRRRAALGSAGLRPDGGDGARDHRRAPGRGRPGLHGLRRFRHRRTRFRDRLRRRFRRGTVALLDRPGRSRERFRGRRPRDGVAHLDRRLGTGRRRRRVGRDSLRPRDGPGHFRHRQHRAAERGHARAGGQPVHQLGRRGRRGNRGLPVALPDRPGRRLGL